MWMCSGEGRAVQCPSAKATGAHDMGLVSDSTWLGRGSVTFYTDKKCEEELTKSEKL